MDELSRSIRSVAYLDLRKRHAVHAREIRRRLAAGFAVASSVAPLSTDCCAGAIAPRQGTVELIGMTGRTWILWRRKHGFGEKGTISVLLLV